MRHQEKIHTARFATKHAWFVTAGEDGIAQLWDAATGAPLSPPFEHSLPVLDARFTEDDQGIVMVDRNGDRWLWPLTFENRPTEELTRLAAELTGQE